jgi:hydrogenase 3 maturation protease
MLPSSWKTSLRRLLAQQTDSSARAVKIAILGIGNTYRSDDAAGVLVARALAESRIIRDLEHVLVMDGGHAPENRTAELRRFAPEIILLIDAAEMNDAPGAVRWIDVDELDGMSASTHSMPLSMLAKYLTLELQCDVKLLGIQPRSNDVGEKVDADVLRATNDLVGKLENLLAAALSPCAKNHRLATAILADAGVSGVATLEDRQV